MQNLPNLRCSSQNVLKFSMRYLRYLRSEFLGEYLPQVDKKHIDDHRTSPFTKYSEIDKFEEYETSQSEIDPKKAKLYPELFPYLPLVHLRDSMRERIERREMMKRRKQITIPEFYAGSIMAVTISDPYMPNRTNRFVGICIYRRILGLLSTLRLRNVIDNMGIEVEYELYNPTVLKIEVLKLERRLDPNLLYLRDALPEYSTVPLDMLPIPVEMDSEVPLNKLLVKMNPRPWTVDWHHHNYRGMQPSAWDEEWHRRRFPWIQSDRTNMKRYDLMVTYRERGPVGDLNQSMRHVEIMHRDLIDFQRIRYERDVMEMKQKKGTPSTTK